MVIDWHNFGYTILALTQGRSSLLVRISYIYEKFFSQLADSHLCVTKAMRNWLNNEWNVQASVLYDRAPCRFRRTTQEEKHDLFIKLGGIFGVQSSDSTSETKFTEVSSGVEDAFHMKVPRPVLLMSSTSWTPDEDFSPLLEALIYLEKHITRPENWTLYPDFIVAVTGKGPLKEEFEQTIRLMNMKRVHIRTLWLEASDYPRLVGSADLGISLHTSSSGLDLPMKVVDMLGSGTPVISVAYSCIHELVIDGVNGFTFSSPTNLFQLLCDLFHGFTGADSSMSPMLHDITKNVRNEQAIRWDENWNSVCLPIFGV